MTEKDGALKDKKELMWKLFLYIVLNKTASDCFDKYIMSIPNEYRFGIKDSCYFDYIYRYYEERNREAE